MSILADPVNSQVLLIDAHRDKIDGFDKATAAALTVGFTRLSCVADCVGVPRYFAITDSKPADDDWLSLPCEQRRKRVYEVRPGTAVLAEPDLLEAIRAEARSKLFVCGFWLDDVVTATALEALFLGFDAHIVVDLSLAHDRRQRTPSLDRCNQYGVVPITLLNLIYEWIANSGDESVRQVLIAQWKAQQELERRGASA